MLALDERPKPEVFISTSYDHKDWLTLRDVIDGDNANFAGAIIELNGSHYTRCSRHKHRR